MAQILKNEKMELETAIEILEYHQEWRLGKREDMIHEPKKLTQALGIVLGEVKNLHLGAVRQRSTYPKGCLTDSEWRELVTLEYVLTWGYTDNEAEDSKRHRKLSDKRWASLNVD